MQAALPDLSGQAQRIDQWKGRVLVINFWATWCPPCREEIPAFIRAQEKLGPKGLQVVGIAVDQLDKVKPYAAEMRINYPVLVGDLEAIDLARQAGNRLGGLALYRSSWIAREHRFKTELGGVNQEKLERIILPLSLAAFSISLRFCSQLAVIRRGSAQGCQGTYRYPST